MGHVNCLKTQMSNEGNFLLAMYSLSPTASLGLSLHCSIKRCGGAFIQHTYLSRNLQGDFKMLLTKLIVSHIIILFVQNWAKTGNVLPEKGFLAFNMLSFSIKMGERTVQIFSLR
ncbi:hypothetical protein KIL84_000598 [Mauremys mutica]|uniref:Uncharacterized protein n=1 Tax=Mauremys mutica TaxID=74926 RepID=A0A9D3WYE7_9SAUR|nr:hypothetical protein KIL84_000598 [Mauremys mutica]